MKKISVFVAGAKKLSALRLRLKAMANDLNNEFKQKNIDTFVNMVSYENFGEEQSEYNKFIAEEADLVVFLLEDRIGEVTEMEYRLVVSCNEKKGRPEYSVLLREFDEKTPEIAYIEELMHSTSHKYYVSYSNPDDLVAKVKSRIMNIVDENKKKTLSGIIPDRKGIGRYIFLSLFISLLLLVAARFATGPLKTCYVYFDIGLYEGLKQNGIDKKYVEQNIISNVQDEASKAQKKLNFILNDSVFDTPEWTIDFPKDISIGRYNRLRNALRTMLGCHDLNVTLNFIESGNDSIINHIIVTDWNHNIEHYETREKDVSLALRNDAAFISHYHNPIVSILYDYQFLNELQWYQRHNPWKDGAFEPAQRVFTLEEYAKSGLPNAVVALLLLGNYYESVGLANGFERRSNYEKAIECYAPLLDDPCVGTMMKKKTESLNLGLSSVAGSSETNLVMELESKGAFVLGDCEQLLIVGDEESFPYKSKYHYNATLYTFEKRLDGSWNKKFDPFTVHLGVYGFVSPEEKKEGDLKTPTGYYALPFGFGKKNDLNTKFNFIEIGPKHVWVSDTKSSAYNTIVVDEDGKYMNNKNEQLFNMDRLYDYAIVIDYNMEARIPGKGSAIFIHIEREENHSTAGCIAMSREEIIKLIEWLDSSKNPHIYLTK